MLDMLYDEYGDIPQIGASVDGVIYPDDIRTDGAALVLCKDEDAKVKTDAVKCEGIIESAEELAKKVRCSDGVIMLHFPMIHIPSAIKFAQFFAHGYYYSKRSKKRNPEGQRTSAGKFSDYCDRENIFYQSSRILNVFAKQTNYKIPILGMNVMHTQVRFNSPNIFCNFEDLNGGIAALTLEKKNIKALYDDIFPQKGKTLEETIHIVGNEFKIIREFNAKFEKNVLISLDNKPPVEAVKNLIYVPDEEEKQLHEHLEKGNFNVQRPYELLFFNKNTNGAFLVGIGAYFPFELFPFYQDVSDYSEKVALVYEILDDKFDAFISCLSNLKHKDGKLVYFSVDVGAIAAFGKKAFTYKDKVKGLLGDNYFGIISAPCSAYIPHEFRLRDYLSETCNNTFFTSAGTSSCIEI